MSKKKSLGQIAYEADLRGGIQNFGAWESAPQLVRDIHISMCKKVERVVIRRLKDKYKKLGVILK